MRISDWSSDVCSSDLKVRGFIDARRRFGVSLTQIRGSGVTGFGVPLTPKAKKWPISLLYSVSYGDAKIPRSEEHTSELQSLMRISYAVLCLKKKNKTKK